MEKITILPKKRITCEMDMRDEIVLWAISQKVGVEILGGEFPELDLKMGQKMYLASLKHTHNSQAIDLIECVK